MDIKKIFYGVAVADAIGRPVEFITPTEKDFDKILLRPTYYSDDTQMALFLAEELASTFSGKGIDFKLAYSKWGLTQVANKHQYSAGLLGCASLYDQRAPGGTCLSSALDLKKGIKVVNNSKGNGTIMRCFPLALYGVLTNQPIDKIVQLSGEDAQTTHKHPYASACSMFLTKIQMDVLNGFLLSHTINQEETLSLLPLELQELMNKVKDWGGFLEVNDADDSWVAEGCLAIALGCVYHSSGDWIETIKRAVLRKGDSDTVAAVAASILGCLDIHPPKELVYRLQERDPIEYVVNQLMQLKKGKKVKNAKK